MLRAKPRVSGLNRFDLEDAVGAFAAEGDFDEQGAVGDEELAQGFRAQAEGADVV